MMTRQANKHEAAEAKLPGARLIALRVWSVVGAIIIGVAILNVMGVLAPSSLRWARSSRSSNRRS